jgi:hypothetical protein
MAELFNEHWSFGPGAHQAHIAAQDIEELGQLINVGVPEPVSDAGATAVVIRCPDGPCFLLGIAPHASELDDPESSSPLPHPLLGIKNRPARCQQNGHGNDREKRSQDQKSEGGEDNVGQALRRASSVNLKQRPE